jgi:hypothetical protein
MNNLPVPRKTAKRSTNTQTPPLKSCPGGVFLCLDIIDRTIYFLLVYEQVQW